MKRVGLITILTILVSLLVGSNVVMAAPATYVVKSGDSLWSIANANGLSVQVIKELNGLGTDFLRIGQSLQLSGTAAPAVVQAAPATPVANQSSDYIIQVGDNLWSIAQKFGTTVANIRALNGLTGDALYAGETLKVSGTPNNPNVSRAGDRVGTRVVTKAAEYLGTPYRYGGSDSGGFDCSGFTSFIFKHFQISLNRTAAGQYSNGVAVSKENLDIGDLVFFNCAGSGISHVGIYCGNNEFIHSSSPRSGGVIYSSLGESYYASSYVGARRVIR